MTVVESFQVTRTEKVLAPAITGKTAVLLADESVVMPVWQLWKGEPMLAVSSQTFIPQGRCDIENHTVKGRRDDVPETRNGRGAAEPPRPCR